jgi:nucleoside-diphosphate-sugar epimerase
MSKILITAAAAFVGSYLTDRLLAEGDQMLVAASVSTAPRVTPA